MNLKQYLQTSDTKRKDFCSSLGIHYQHLNNILRGKRNPSADLALRIEEATGGAVTRMELLYPDAKSLVTHL
jgi:plasmid maintenance system antidote protein VapI